MAKATKRVVCEVTLELTSDEAAALCALVGSVPGDINEAPRKHTDAIYDALDEIGIRNDAYKFRVDEIVA